MRQFHTSVDMPISRSAATVAHGPTNFTPYAQKQHTSQFDISKICTHNFSLAYKQEYNFNNFHTFCSERHDLILSCEIEHHLRALAIFPIGILSNFSHCCCTPVTRVCGERKLQVRAKTSTVRRVQAQQRLCGRLFGLRDGTVQIRV